MSTTDHSNELADGDVARALAEYNRLLGANDVEAALAYCADDVRLMPPSGPVIEGRAALRRFIDGWPTYEKSDAYDIRVEVRDDLAVATCAAAVVHVDADGNDRALAAKQMATVRRLDGAWKITALIFNAEPRPETDP